MTHNMVPEPGQHMAIVGKTGSGKTTSACVVLDAVAQSGYPVLVIDSKGEQKFESLPAAHIVSLPSQLSFHGTEIYRPEGALNTPDYLDAVIQKAYESLTTMYVVVDEGYQVCNHAKPGRGLADGLMRGRMRFVNGRRIRMSMIVLSQRPAWIPRHVFSESSHYLMHNLGETDRKTMAEHMGEKVVNEPVEGHYAYYYNHKMKSPVKILVKVRE